MRKVGVLGTVASLFAAGLSIAVAAPAAANGCTQPFSGGDGQSADTAFQISSAQDLLDLQGDNLCWGYFFQQTESFSMGGRTWNEHAIGTSSNKFTGSYDGDGNQITGLTIEFDTGSTDGGNYAGLFGYLTGTVSNLGFSGSVTGRNQVGGLVGYSANGELVNVFTTGTVDSTVGDNVGGLVGYKSGGSVTGSFATGSVTGKQSRVGGLIGYLGSSGTVEDSFATGAVEGVTNVGGLIGSAELSTVTNSYSTGAVTGTTDVGGLIGRSFVNTVSGALWNESTSGRTAGGGDVSGGTFSVTGATTAQMQTLSTFTDAGWTSIADSWVPSNTWGICEGSGYPYLTWQYTSNTEACGGGSTPAASSGTATYTFTFLTSTGGVCFVDDNVAAGAYALPTSQVACTPAGSELVGWSVRGQVGAFSDGGVVTASGDQTFTAVAKDPTMAVTFDPNVGLDTACLLDGSDVDPGQRAVEVALPRGGVIGEVDICAPAGHALAGWTDRPTTDGPYAPVQGAMLLTTGMEMPATWNHDPNPVNNIRLYAVWSPAS